MSAPIPIEQAILRRRRARFLGLTWDDAVKCFFGGNAWLAIIVLALITIFLFKEGLGFFEQNRRNLELYRQAGLEYVDILKRQSERFTALNRQLNQLRVAQIERLLREGRSLEEANAALAEFDAFSATFSAAGGPLYGLVSDLTEVVSATKEAAIVRADKLREQEMLRRMGRLEEAAAVEVGTVDFAAAARVLRSVVDQTYGDVAREVTAGIEQAVAKLPELPTPAMNKALAGFREDARNLEKTFESNRARLAAWNPEKPVPWVRSAWVFFTGREWLTASFWQDWYGILPLLAGSLLVSAIALSVAVPLGVAGAIYVNQVASAREQSLIKPSIEFIAAFPSVVLGFFGIVVLGEFLRDASEWEWLSRVPFFPIQERLNATTAGLLLGLMAVPTIFSLAEDAINNVPVHYKEASFALGASRLQTLVRIILPASLSGIIAAILLGFGRVIGETMVVLLCAGNRIAIPDASEGLGVIFQPVHTMTGIIAQEMGEVEYGGIHYQALFMVAIVLFLLALVINYFAQKIVQRFRISIG